LFPAAFFFRHGPTRNAAWLAASQAWSDPKRCLACCGKPGSVSGRTIHSRGVITIVRTPPIRVMFCGPRTGAAGPAAILCVRQLGSQAWLAPQRVKISNQGTVCNRYPRGISIPPPHNHSPPCIVIIQYTACRVGALPPLASGSNLCPGHWNNP
jgi:hypothetical protein